MDGNGTSTAILVGVWATFALDVFGSFTSSPQTTEINASTRADTLMKYVAIAATVAVAGGAYASWKSGKAAPLLATSVVALAMYRLYCHARDKGLASDEAGTESDW
jgi:hypothetical protein